MQNRCIFIILECWVLVVIRVWIKQEIGGCKSIYVRRVVVCDVMVVEEFTCVVGVVAVGLKPDGEVVVV